MIGDAPKVLTILNPVKLSLVSKTVTKCQALIFFARSDQTIKGWHTFSKGRPGDNVGNMTLMARSGWKGNILVVLCGPFTSKQALLTQEKVSVDPQKVIAAWVWLKANNFRYADITVPCIVDILLPYVMDDKR